MESVITENNEGVHCRSRHAIAGRTNPQCSRVADCSGGDSIRSLATAGYCIEAEASREGARGTFTR